MHGVVHCFAYLLHGLILFNHENLLLQQTNKINHLRQPIQLSIFVIESLDFKLIEMEVILFQFPYFLYFKKFVTKALLIVKKISFFTFLITIYGKNGQIHSLYNKSCKSDIHSPYNQNKLYIIKCKFSQVLRIKISKSLI